MPTFALIRRRCNAPQDDKGQMLALDSTPGVLQQIAHKLDATSGPHWRHDVEQQREATS